MKKRISEQMSQILDKNVNFVLKRIRQDVGRRIYKVRGDLTSDIEELQARTDSVVDAQPGLGLYDRTLNMAIR